jgi:Putative MetA-pathway of phenol degradation
MIGKVITFAAAAVLAWNAGGQEVQPDRPTFCTGIQIVPARHVQVELGATVSFSGGAKDFGIGELRVRVPLASWVEVGLGVTSLNVHRSGSGGAGGSAAPTDDLATSQLHFKIRLLDSGSTDFGVLVGSRLPGGGGVDREIHAEPYGGLILDQGLSGTVSLTANIGGVYLSSGEGEQFGVLLGGVAVTLAVSARASLYGEAYFWSRLEPGDPPVQSLGAGIQYLLTKKISLDFRAGVGFGRTSPDWFTGVGAAILF